MNALLEMDNAGRRKIFHAFHRSADTGPFRLARSTNLMELAADSNVVRRNVLSTTALNMLESEHTERAAMTTFTVALTSIYRTGASTVLAFWYGGLTPSDRLENQLS